MRLSQQPRKVASYDPRYSGGWFVWDRKLRRVVSYHGNRKWEAEQFATQLEMDDLWEGAA